jgi:hypothetical protein
MTVLTPESKKKLLDILEAAGIIRAKFTGKVAVSIQEGGIRFIEVSETIK